MPALLHLLPRSPSASLLSSNHQLLLLLRSLSDRLPPNHSLPRRSVLARQPVMLLGSKAPLPGQKGDSVWVWQQTRPRRRALVEGGLKVCHEGDDAYSGNWLYFYCSSTIGSGV